MFRNLLVIGFTLLLMAVSLEIGLRIWGYSDRNFYAFDSQVGKVLRPGISGWQTKEGNAFVEINSHGQRDIKHSKEKAPEVIRIAVLGDSYAQASQVPLEQSFWKVAESHLNNGCKNAGENRFEFINFGVDAYGTAQEYLMLRHKAWDFKPDLVLVAFTSGNDVRNNSRELEGDPLRPYFILEDGELKLDDSFKNTTAHEVGTSRTGKLIYGLFDNIRLLQLANEARKGWRVRQAQNEDDEGEDRLVELGLAEEVFKEPKTAAWKAAWEVTDALIARIVEDSAEEDARTLVMVVSHSLQVHPDSRLRNDIQRKLGVEDLYYTDRRVVSVARNAGAVGFMTAPALLDWAETNGECVHGFKNAGACSGHWNAVGHRIAGELLGKNICASLE